MHRDLAARNVLGRCQLLLWGGWEKVGGLGSKGR